MPVICADGTDLAGLMRATSEAADLVRSSRGPATLLIENVPRRFGHAATDRQLAYLTADEMERQMAIDPVATAAAAAVRAGVVPSADAILEEYEQIGELAAAAFDTARAEPRQMANPTLIARAAPPRRPALPRETVATTATSLPASTMADATIASGGAGKSRWEMRPLMTRALGDAMAADERILYVGEDVEHGGYYRVSEGLRERFGRRRIFDWPPDEASLIVSGRAGLGVPAWQRPSGRTDLGASA